ncbi:MAG TPA: hypothetical protein HA330_02145 [Candidatus Thalassarchaeaceae archaeon]|nr:MAG TPA: hypothetical protein D7H85_02155 [Candidatus Poseidoniales archaeon]HII48667.1 hypothetical protein [Candidatus Thalassarchaeaceae archaeon]|tara:strand:- start:1063 stop:1746 length:684 start_codon:yes stop_codon:yes gene_type:complete
MAQPPVGGNRIAVGWTLSLICWIFAILVLVVPPSDDTDGSLTSTTGDTDAFPNEPSREETELAACCCVSGFLPLLMVSSGRSAKKRAFKAQFMQSQIAASYPSIEQQRMMAQQNMIVQQQMAEQQKIVNAKIILKEKQRIAAEKEAVRLKAQMDQSASHTTAQMQSMLDTLNQLKESAEQSEREKQELEQKLEETKATTVVQNITYNIQDSAIAGDIHPGLNKQDDS